MFACRMCRLHLWLSLRRPQMQTAHTRTRTRTQHTESANSSAAPTQTQLSSAQLRMRLARQARRLLGAKRRMRRRVEFNLRTPIGRPTRLLCNATSLGLASRVACLRVRVCVLRQAHADRISRIGNTFATSAPKPNRVRAQPQRERRRSHVTSPATIRLRQLSSSSLLSSSLLLRLRLHLRLLV